MHMSSLQQNNTTTEYYNFNVTFNVSAAVSNWSCATPALLDHFTFATMPPPPKGTKKYRAYLRRQKARRAKLRNELLKKKFEKLLPAQFRKLADLVKKVRETQKELKEENKELKEEIKELKEELKKAPYTPHSSHIY